MLKLAVESSKAHFGGCVGCGQTFGSEGGFLILSLGPQIHPGYTECFQMFFFFIFIFFFFRILKNLPPPTPPSLPPKKNWSKVKGLTVFPF